MNLEKLNTRVTELFNEVLSWREHMHRFPEPSFQEKNTMLFVSEILNRFGISHEVNVAETGLVAWIGADHHTQEHPCLGLRADLDALPILEENDVPYKSTNPGWMHACGHDVHTSILLGTAVILQENRNLLEKPVKLIFQPGEEMNPGGASLMMKAGVLKNPSVEKMYALHVFPEMEVGHIGLRPGLYMASSDELHVQINGVGGHGALPEKCINPIEMGALWMSRVKTRFQNECPEGVPHVLTFGRFEALGSTNVIPSLAHIKGTFRTMDEIWRARAYEILTDEAKAVSLLFGGEMEVNISKGYPFLKNDEVLTEQVKINFEQVFGQDKIHPLDLRMTAEDFAFYSQEIPVCFFRLGVGNKEKGITYAVHHPRFDIDPESLKMGMVAMCSIAFNG
ncbi:MAG: M20 family metallopeptidase [Flavobacteriales bacterium]